MDASRPLRIARLGVASQCRLALRPGFPWTTAVRVDVKPALEALAPMRIICPVRYPRACGKEFGGELVNRISDPLYQAGRFVTGSVPVGVAVESL
jgi:hypothetical protein